MSRMFFNKLARAYRFNENLDAIFDSKMNRLQSCVAQRMNTQLSIPKGVVGFLCGEVHGIVLVLVLHRERKGVNNAVYSCI